MDEMRKLHDELVEKWLGRCLHNEGFEKRVYDDDDSELICKKCGKDTYGDYIPSLSTTWNGFGLLMSEAERRGWCDVSMLTFDGEVMCTLTHKYGAQVRATGKDKRHAFALACRDAAKMC